jgi:hypothetical protein
METEGEQTPAAAPKPPGPESGLARIVGTFLSPVRTFAAIATRPTFLAPLVLWTALSFLVSELVLSRTDWRAVVLENAARREAKMTEAQIDQAVETSQRLKWVFELFAAAAPAAIAAITAGALWIGCQAFGWELRFRQSFGVVAHAYLPGVLAAIVLFAVLWGRSTIDPQEIDDLLRTSPAFLVDRRADRTLHSLLASFDALSVWSMMLMTLGLSSATGASRGRVAALVLSLWGLYVLGKAGLGIVFS